MWPRNSAGRWNDSATAQGRPMSSRRTAPRGWWLMALAAVAGGETRLVDAVKAGNREAVRVLIKNRADVNAAGPDGTTALAWAAEADDLQTAERLLRAGANPKIANRYGVTPLSLAATN